MGGITISDESESETYERPIEDIVAEAEQDILETLRNLEAYTSEKGLYIKDVDVEHFKDDCRIYIDYVNVNLGSLKE